MKKKASMKYKRINDKEIKITYNYSNGKSTEIVARVVKPGSYTKCETPDSKEKKCA